MLPVQLDHIDLLVSSQRKFDNAVEPRGWNFPGLELRTPFGLRASAIPKPLYVPFGERNARQDRKWFVAFEDDWDFSLTPESFQLRVAQILRHEELGSLSQCCSLAWDRTEAASSFVSLAYRSLAKTRAALSSILAPVYLSPLR